ncbi:hypothetical protein BJY52DRAFT_1227315 [Lactarius psammicola]|nr:hypothetical protein BJY52DRAFT_1227315 [Lactarius psammicola]
MMILALNRSRPSPYTPLSVARHGVETTTSISHVAFEVVGGSSDHQGRERSPGLFVARAIVSEDRGCYYGPSTYEWRAGASSLSLVTWESDFGRHLVQEWKATPQAWQGRSVLGGRDDLGPADISGEGDLSFCDR